MKVSSREVSKYRGSVVMIGCALWGSFVLSVRELGRPQPDLDRVSRWVLSAALIPTSDSALLDPGSFADTVSTRAAVDRAAQPLAGDAPRSIPSLQRSCTRKNCDLSSPPSLAVGVLCKHLGFFSSECASECVAPSLSRTA